MNILLAGGGSIGHVAPCLAVAQALCADHPDTIFHFLCSEREEEIAFVKAAGIPCTPIPLPRRNASLPFTFIKALRLARRTIGRFRPDAVFCKGGAVSVPVALAARRTGVPILLHESDAVMGRANRIIARWADVVCIGFPNNLQPTTYHLTGNPVRAELTNGSHEEALRITGLSGTRPVLLVIAGSQGSQTFNRIVAGTLEELLRFCDVIHLTGPRNEAPPRRHGYWSAQFAGEELKHLYALADLALSRSGANVLTELAANGIPSLLVPLEGVAQDHQRANAVIAEKSGGCMLIAERDLERTFLPTVRDLLGNREKLQTMGKKMQTLWNPAAAKDIAQQILRITKEK